MNHRHLTLSALRLASLACCSQASALSMALSFSSFMACIFFLMASIVVLGLWLSVGRDQKLKSILLNNVHSEASAVIFCPNLILRKCQ